MTKTKLLLASLLLVVGLGVMAPCAVASTPITQYPSWMSYVATQYWVRPNGGAEAMGPITLTFTTGYGIVDGGQVFTITYGLPIVGASSVASAPISDFCTDTVAGAFCNQLTASASGNTITFKNKNTAITGMLNQSVTFYGIRCNVIGLAMNSSISATITALLDHTDPLYFGVPPSQAITAPVAPATLLVALVAGPPLTVTAPVNCATGVPSTPDSVLTCVSAQKHERDGSKTGFSMIVAENWSGAWTSLSDELAIAPFAPNVGLTVTNGSDVSITITGIPEGVTVNLVSITVPSGCTSCGEIWNTGGITVNGVSGTSYTGTMWNDSALFDAPLSYENHTEVESAQFNFTVSLSPPITPDDPPMAVSVNLDPYNNSMTAGPSGLYPWFYYATGAEEYPGSPISVFEFIDCKTALLFPYITNYTTGAGGGALGNWDTFVNIADATSDPWYLTVPWHSAIPQNGACTFYTYNAGQVPGTGPVAPTEFSPIVWTTPFVQLSGGEFGVGADTFAPGVSGAYLIVICDFLNATGYAQVTDNFGQGNWQVMSSYLAYVIPNIWKVSRAKAGNGYGEFAIMPVDGAELQHKIIHEMWKVFWVATHP